jgi:hypothetical protein
MELKRKLQRIQVEQRLDPKIWEIIERATQGERPRYKVHNDVLYKWMDDQWRIVLPQHLLEEVTWACHESLAHAGAYRCYLALKEDFVCNNMARRVKAILKTCHACQTARHHKAREKEREAREIERENRILEQLSSAAGTREKSLIVHIQKTQQIAEKKLAEHIVNLKQDIEKMQDTHKQQIQECKTKINELNDITIEHSEQIRDIQNQIFSTDTSGTSPP